MTASPDRKPFDERTVGAHQLALLRDGMQAFPAMLEAIACAKRSVCLETYILRSDKTGHKFAEALADRAQSGVEVNLLYDAWGSSVSQPFLKRLRETGVRVLAFRPLSLAPLSPEWKQVYSRFSRRDHRKALVVDGETAFIGGLNITDDYAAIADGGKGWRDTHLRLVGPAAAELEFFFLRTWKREGGAPLEESRYAQAGRRADPRVTIVSNDVRRIRNSIRELYRIGIQNAQRSISITNAYFLPTVRLIHALTAAARRGVEVQIITAGTTDVPAVLLASRSTYKHLTAAGVRVFEWRGRVLHAKTAVIDGRWSTVGSSNLDSQSLRRNIEANAIISDEGFASALESMFADDLRHTEEITSEFWEHRNVVERAMSWGAYLLKDWL